MVECITIDEDENLNYSGFGKIYLTTHGRQTGFLRADNLFGQIENQMKT